MNNQVSRYFVYDNKGMFRLPGGTEARRLSAVTVLAFGEAASAVLTLLSTYLFPAVS
jgi:hypothetical protein